MVKRRNELVTVDQVLLLLYTSDSSDSNDDELQVESIPLELAEPDHSEFNGINNDGDGGTGTNGMDNDGTDNDATVKLKRNKRPAADTWNHNTCIKGRLMGKAYKNRKGVVKPKLGNLDNEIYLAHVLAKDEAWKEKEEDKKAANEEKMVWTMDMQTVLLCPRTKASGAYYKTKLQVHNFTLYDLQTKEGFCYLWEEHEDDLSSKVFAFLQYTHFERIIQERPGVKEVIIWSDGCGYQNRNLTVSNAYLRLARKCNVKITQKYLVAGHTQMEVNSMHSTIERNIAGDIYTPRDYFVIMQSAIIRPTPYNVKQIFHNDFKKLTGCYMKSIRPGKKCGDPTVHDLRALEYNYSGTVRFKLKFSADWEGLPQRIRITQEPFEWVQVFDGPKPLTYRKFTDLQSMKMAFPVVYTSLF